MKIWIDAQLSPAVAVWISRTFDDIEAESVRSSGLRDATDPEIFESVKKAGAVVMSKDDDFIQHIEQRGTPPKLIWITSKLIARQHKRRIVTGYLKSQILIIPVFITIN